MLVQHVNKYATWNTILYPKIAIATSMGNTMLTFWAYSIEYKMLKFGV